MMKDWHFHNPRDRKDSVMLGELLQRAVDYIAHMHESGLRNVEEVVKQWK